MSGLVKRVAVIGVVVVVIAIAGFIFRDRLTSSPASLQVGDCFDLDNPTADTVDSVPHHPCTESHHYEVIFVATDASPDGAAYPGTTAFDTDVQAQCVPAFATYVGVSLDQSALQLGYFYPQADSWAKKNRSLTCYASRVDNAALTASVKNSKQ